MLSLRVWMVVWVGMSLLAACPVPGPVTDAGGEGEGEDGEGEGCGGDDDTGFPAPNGDITDAVGSSATLDFATWNLAQFGDVEESGTREVGLVADLIASMRLDLIAVQEIESPTAFDELVQRLPDHEGLLERAQSDDPEFDQRVGFLYRCGRLTPVGEPRELFAGNGNFPREPLQVTFRYDDGAAAFDFVAIVVHFKAFQDAESSARRAQAFTLLQNYVAGLVDGDDAPDNVVVLGDFNERLDDPVGRDNWAPFLDEARYVVRTQPLVDRGEASFISGSNAILDHIVTSRGFDDEAGAATVAIPRLDADVANYRDDVSDHRPVTLVLRGF